MYIHNMLLRIYYLEFSNLSPLLFSRYILLLITIHAITWNARVSRSRRDANKVSISSTTVTSCFLTSDCSWLRSNGAVTKWIRGWSKWDTWVSVSTRKADFRSLYTALSCVKETPSPPLVSIPRYICISFFFLHDAAARFSTAEFGSAFPTRGIVCNDLWLRSARTSQQSSLHSRNSRPILEANQDSDALPLYPCLMNPHEY